MNDKPKHRRRRFQISLRTLLLLVTVAACAFGWSGYKVRAKQRERAAVEAIGKLGGYVEYDYEYDSGGNPTGSPPPGPDWLRRLAGEELFANVVHVNLNCTTTAAGLAHIEDLTQLKYLGLESTQISNSGLAYLQGLTQLTNLNLDNTKITDAGLAHLKKLHQLEILHLRHTKVTDSGLAKVRGLNRLTVLVHRELE